MNLLSGNMPTPLVEITVPLTTASGVRLFVKRDDMIHPFVSGNKWRKLKYNLVEARALNASSIVTFGGPHSNHLFATAAAGKELGLPSVGIVRGEENSFRYESSTLRACKDFGMELRFISRSEYREKDSDAFLDRIRSEFDNSYILPEGGSSALAVKGMEEMVSEVVNQLGYSPDYLSIAAGTGGSTAGILTAGQKVVSFSVLKGGGFLKNDIAALVPDPFKPENLDLQTGYHFGGYGKWSDELIHFIQDFKRSHGIQLEQVYTGKMMYGLLDLISRNYFPSGSTIVAIHTGGLQGLLPAMLS